MNVQLLDTTLRDGEQGDGQSFTPEGAVKVVKLLDGVVDIIEAGFAGANFEMDRRFELIYLMQQEKKLDSRIAAFGMTRTPFTKADDHKKNHLIKKIEDTRTPVVVIVGKTWDYHVEKALEISLDENIRMIEDTVRHFSVIGKEVIFDAEVFTSALFGGLGIKPNRNYALDCIQAAKESGASRIVLCDTNGILMPHMVQEVVYLAKERLRDSSLLGFHGHNDLGLATAISLEMVKYGVGHLQATVNGIGERTGNTSLEQVIANLTSPNIPSKMYEGDTTRLFSISQEVSLLGKGHLPSSSLPIVGITANTDKAGIHASAMKRAAFAYRGRDLQEEFGTPSRIVVSGVGGSSNVAMALGIEDSRSSYVNKVNNKVNELIAQGYDFQEAEASFYVIAKRLEPTYNDLMVILGSDATEEKDGGVRNVATIEANVNGKYIKVSSEGTGPVNASYKAIVDAFATEYPEVRKIHFRGFKAVSTSAEEDTSQSVKVYLTFSLPNGSDRIYTTMGVSKDIIEASRIAAVDGLEYGLMKLEVNKL